ncbi:MAG: superoxide dismutase [Elusimicrobia bacterium]|nr:superoxide dismutase [Elusimicrobiota bacterium]
MPYVYQTRADLRPRGLDGISDKQVAQHWALYEGYVNNVNALNKKLAGFIAKGDFGLEYAELKRRLGFEYNGMILHEHYFGSLKAGQQPPNNGSDLERMLGHAFGGFDSWKKEFTAMGKIRGVGWVVLYLDPQHEILSNHWVTLHEDGHPAGFAPILVMDVWEHAYMVDWGADGRGDYISAFFKNVAWRKVEENLHAARRAVKV